MVKVLAVLLCSLVAAVSGFTAQPSAFAVSSAARSSQLSVRAATVAPASPLMACRTNTKREKFFRNLEVS
jgi:hypothetical protein